jgi:predicted transcriptional regulator
MFDLLRRINPWSRQPETVTLEPDEQIILRLLLEVGQGTRESIQTEVTSTRVEGEAQVDEALTRLENKGMILTGSDGAAGVYRPAPKARKLKGHLPVEPLTVTDFYL